MVLDRVVVVDDFYCNAEDVANNAKSQLSETHMTTSGGNMNASSMQNAFQRYMSHKITDFIDLTDDEHKNGCFTKEFEADPDKWHKTDWAGLIFLGFEDAVAVAARSEDGPRGMNSGAPPRVVDITDDLVEDVVLVLEQGNIKLALNKLVLFRSRYQDTPKLLGGGNTKKPIFQLFFYNTHNNHFFAQDHYVVLDRLRQIKTLHGVLSAEKCQEYIDIAERWATENNNGSWTRERHNQYPTTDIPVSFLSFNDELVATVKEKVFPEVSKQFLFPEESLSLYDFFIVKYDANAQSKLDWHRDVSLISFNFALNNEFEGGGTSHPAADEPVRIGTGDVLMHTGKLLHSGNHVTSGVRYIIVAFVHVDSDRVNYDFIKRKSRSGISDEGLFQNLLLY